MGGKGDIVHALDGLFQVCDQVIHFFRGDIAHGVGNVDGGSAVGDGGLHDFRQEELLTSGGVFCGEFDVVAEALGVANHFRYPLDDLIRAHSQLILHVQGRSRQEHVDPGVLRYFHGVPRRIDIFLHCPGQRSHDGAFHRLGDGPNRFKIPRGGDGEARFDDVHVQPLQLLCHFDFFC